MTNGDSVWLSKLGLCPLDWKVVGLNPNGHIEAQVVSHEQRDGIRKLTISLLGLMLYYDDKKLIFLFPVLGP